MAVPSKSARGRAQVDVLQALRQKREQELASGYAGYGRFGVEILLRWSSWELFMIDDLPNL